MEIEKVSLKLERNLLKKIDEHALLNMINRSEAMRNLIEIGLQVAKIKNESSSNIDDEIMKMNIDMWLILAQLYRLLDRNEDKIDDIKKDFSKKYRSVFKSKFTLISDKFDEYLEIKDQAP